MFKAYKLPETDVHYHWICLSHSAVAWLIEFHMPPHILPFSIFSLQKHAPHWANPHFKDFCLSIRNKAQSENIWPLLNFPHLSQYRFFLLWQRNIIRFISPPSHPKHHSCPPCSIPKSASTVPPLLPRWHLDFSHRGASPWGWAGRVWLEDMETPHP